MKAKDEITRVRQLQKETEQLKKLLLKKDMDALIDESYLEVAAEQLGHKSVVELKKAEYQALTKARRKSGPLQIRTCKNFWCWPKCYILCFKASKDK